MRVDRNAQNNITLNPEINIHPLFHLQFYLGSSAYAGIMKAGKNLRVLFGVVPGIRKQGNSGTNFLRKYKGEVF